MFKYALGALLALTLMPFTPAAAADLGGNCCADLEERIAELETTTARKGNRKLRLTVTGQVNGAISYASLGDFSKTQVIQNGNDRSYLRLEGDAQINQDFSAGYVVEFDLAQLGALGAPAQSQNPSVRQSYFFLRSKTFGQVAVGRISQATNDLDMWSTNDTWIAGKPHSLGALADQYLTGIDLPFDGDYRNSVRYDSPTIEGFTLSASWGASNDNSINGGDTYDIALRYAGAFGDVKGTAAVGYRHSTDLAVNLLGTTTLLIPTGDVDTFLANASLMHIPTGLFVNASYSDQSWADAHFGLTAYDVQAGIEAKLLSFGHSTFFGEWGRFTFDPDGAGSTDVDYYGAGIVQAINPAAMDLYVGYRHYATGDLLGSDADTVTGGARIRF